MRNFSLIPTMGTILNQPDLVNLWKNMGYHGIYGDVNELAIPGAILLIYPPNPPSDWEPPFPCMIITRLKRLVNMGFRLTDGSMEEVLHTLEHRLDKVGDYVMETFQLIRNESKSDIASSCLVPAIKPDRDHQKTDLLQYLVEIANRPMDALRNALNHYRVGFKLNAESIKTTKLRSLSVHSNVYYWILESFGPNSELTRMCFDDILESRVWIDLKLREYNNRLPGRYTDDLNSICSIYLEYCNGMVPFQPNHLNYLRMTGNDEILGPFFGITLPVIYHLPLKEKLPLKINYDGGVRPQVKLTTPNNNRRRDFILERKIWKDALEIEYDQLHTDNPDINDNFKKKLVSIWKEINDQNKRTNKQTIKTKRLK